MPFSWLQKQKFQNKDEKHLPQMLRHGDTGYWTRYVDPVPKQRGPKLEQPNDWI